MNKHHVLVRDVPYFVWLFGLGFGGIGLFLLLNGSAPKLMGGIFTLVGLLIILFTPIVTVVLDRGSGLLKIQKTGILIRTHRKVPVMKIASAYVQGRSSTDSDGTSTMYRVVVALEDGEKIPLRTAFSSGYRGKEKQADAIQTALGISGEDQDPAWANEIIQKSLQKDSDGDQEAVIGIPTGLQETDGVKWELETFSFGGVADGSPVYRWSSMDFETNGYFLYLAQRLEGQGKQKGLMNLVGNFLIKQSIRMYGFDESYIPGIEDAVSLDGIDRRLVDDFFVYTSSPNEARRMLSPWAVMPLLGWAKRYASERRSKTFHQMSVLFSPFGIYVSVLNTLDAAQVDELVALGVELVRAQGIPRQQN